MLDAAAALRLGQVALLVFIAAVDIRTRRIHAGALVALAGASMLGSLLLGEPALLAALVGAACGGGVFWLAHVGGRRYGKRVNLPEDVVVFGIGDVFLMAAVGLAVGFPAVALTMALAVGLGGLGAGLYVIASLRPERGHQREAAMPYAPFIAVAAIAVILRLHNFMTTLAG